MKKLFIALLILGCCYLYAEETLIAQQIEVVNGVTYCHYSDGVIITAPSGYCPIRHVK